MLRHFDPPKDWNCVAGSTQDGLATRRGPITRSGQHSPVMRNPTQSLPKSRGGAPSTRSRASSQSRAPNLGHMPSVTTRTSGQVHSDN